MQDDIQCLSLKVQTARNLCAHNHKHTQREREKEGEKEGGRARKNVLTSCL